MARDGRIGGWQSGWSPRHYELGFFPIREERYDFAIPASRWDRPAVSALREILDTPGVREQLSAMGFPHMNDVGAIVLCGGMSRRMGRPKAWLPFGPDEVMLQRVVRLVREVVGPVVVVAAPEQELPMLPGE